MTASNLGAAMVLIYGSEGGYSNDPQDTGGPTKYGITLATLSAWRKSQQTDDDVKALKLDEAQEIYGKEYAAPVRFDDLATGLDYAVLDFAVNSGPARAVKTLQQIVGTVPDGIMGAKTLAAAAVFDLRDLINKVCDARLEFMQSLSNWTTFGKGWTNRVAKVRDEAAGMVSGVTLTPAVIENTAKAAQSNVKATRTTIGLSTIIAGAASVVAAVGTAGPLLSQASTGLTQAAGQLAPIAGYSWGQTMISSLTGAAALCAAVSSLTAVFAFIGKLRAGEITT